MSQINVDTIRSREGIAPSLDKGVIVTGVTTSTEGYFSGNVTIGGTLTYEDVTNQDVIGLITARSGIKIGNDQDATGIGITLGTGDIGSAVFAGIASVGSGITMYGSTGIVSATQFYGDGANLTGVISGVELSYNGSSVGSAITAINFSGFSSVTAPTAGLSTVTAAWGQEDTWLFGG